MTTKYNTMNKRFFYGILVFTFVTTSLFALWTMVGCMLIEPSLVPNDAPPFVYAACFYVFPVLYGVPLLALLFAVHMCRKLSLNHIDVTIASLCGVFWIIASLVVMILVLFCYIYYYHGVPLPHAPA